MILAAHGIVKDEAELYACCETDIDGTLPGAAAHCARTFGLAASAERLGGLDSLQTQIETADLSLVLFVNLAPLLGVQVLHALVLESIDFQAREIHLLDPAFPPNGKRVWSLDLFERGWELARYQVVWISTAHAHH